MEKLKLKYPFKTKNEQEVTELEVRRPKVHDQVLAAKKSKDPIEQEITILANLCGLAPEDIHEMDGADYQALQEVYTGFFS